ncbi:N-acetyltransferase (plasmid) [Ensifer adhaerens]|uniref:GNAT family N-acetyltransferase n=1 Tax=Ensifer adhaerens TaxID=106592 RepID=UPI0021006B33|nr:N-acetyltransferase [Ensifer adhaerens]UTV41213.1 N-acetyltransferase [Ensifer adhaerens]
MPHRVLDNPQNCRFALSIDADAIAAAYYRMEAGVLVLIHTEVPFENSGAGFATKLANGLFAILRERQQKVAPRCVFMANYAVQHPEYSDLIC